MIGRTLGQYQIVALLGSGGMGVVYRARDLRLERNVALKVLSAGTLADDSARARFRQEALALSRLNHPNIATVYDFNTQDGVDFLAFEFVPGSGLDQVAAGPLPEKQILNLGLQLAEGLEAAHRQGVIHRDLKPANLKLDADGRLKILDFGLAKIIEPASPLSVTRSGAPSQGIVGTFPYMAPEQLRGETVDTRSDIWAAGVILYELASGQRPFSGKTPVALADEIMHSAPPPMHASPQLAYTILKCLAKEPDHRYQSAKELAVDLRRSQLPSASGVEAQPILHRRRGRWIALAAFVMSAIVAASTYLWLRPSPNTVIRSIAVLPVVNATGDPGTDLLSDGVTADVINHLTEVPSLKVIASPSVMTYKGRQVLPQQVGRELHVGAVVLGRMTRNDNQISVQIDLVDASDGSEIWGGQFAQPLSQVQSLQNYIALEVTRRLRLKLSSDQESRLARVPTTVVGAYQAYLRGRYCMTEADPSKLQECEQLFRAAVAADPQYAQAWAGLADSISYRPIFELASPTDVAPEARAAAQRALQLDPNDGEAHASMGIVYLNFDWDLPRAEAELKRAMELNPGDTFGHHWYAHYLEATGDVARANAELHRVVESDPLSPMYENDMAVEYYFLGQYQRVLELAKSWSVGNNDPFGNVAVALAQEKLEGKKKAAASMQKFLASDVASGFTTSMAIGLFNRAGNRAGAVALLDKLKQQAASSYVTPFLMANAYFGLGDDGECFRYLQAAFREHSPDILLFMNLDPQYERLWHDARYIALARRYGLPDVHR